MTLLLLALACQRTDGIDPDDGPEPGDTDADSDTVVAGDLAPTDITAEVSPHVVTVVRVRWTTAQPTVGYVEFGETDGYRWRTPTEATPTTEHEALLLGLWPDATFHFRVVTEDDGTASADHTVTTGTIPSVLPRVTVTGDATFDGWVVMPIQGAEQGIAVLDTEGRYVWYWLVDPAGGPYNLMAAFYAADKQGFAYGLAGSESAGNMDRGSIRRVPWWGEAEQIYALPYFDHDVTQLPDGTFAAVVFEPNDTYGTNADTIVEVTADLTSHTQVWSAWEAYDPETFATDHLGAHNWTHANAIEYEPSTDSYYLNCKEWASLLKIDRPTGEVLWGMNGEANRFEYLDGTEPILLQHQFEVLDGGDLLVFDNGEAARGYSQIVELDVDEAAMTVSQTWDYVRDPPLWVFAKGDVRRLANGNTLVVWSSAGEVQEVTTAGEVVWQLNTDLGYATTFIDLVDSLYAE